MQTLRYRFKCLLLCLVAGIALFIFVSNVNILTNQKRVIVRVTSAKKPIADFEDGQHPFEAAGASVEVAEEDDEPESTVGKPVKAKKAKTTSEEDDRPEVVRVITPPTIPKGVKESERKLIYFASPFFGGPFVFNELPQECRASHDPSDMEKADAVIVHALGGSPHIDMQSEEGRRKMKVPENQVWVGLMYESPAIYSSLPGIYNWTMTFRTDSDIYSPYCGRFELAEKGKTIADQEPLLEKLRVKGNRTKKVAWMVSNCHTSNFRMDYAKELSKYISVDIYGACSPNGLHCMRFGSGNADRACWEMMATEYKFYLSFESSHCKDYITEKLFTPMYYGVLPIVYGGASVEDYQKMAPKHSYIDTRDFNSPKELADYLNKLDKSPEEYEAYFDWRSRYMVHYNRTFVGQDILCGKLWNLDKYGNSYSDKQLNKWWVEGGNCVAPPYKPSSDNANIDDRPAMMGRRRVNRIQ